MSNLCTGDIDNDMPIATSTVVIFLLYSGERKFCLIPKRQSNVPEYAVLKQLPRCKSTNYNSITCFIARFFVPLQCKNLYTMKEYDIRTHVDVFGKEELSHEDRELTEAAMKATENSYAPYSRFRVGAALRLEDGEIIVGSNQENAAYPIGCCAERTALFWCGANRPGAVITAIAIAAQTDGHFTQQPIAPCGMCRQALLEVECRQESPIRVLMYGKGGTHCVGNVKALVPITFTADSMEI